MGRRVTTLSVLLVLVTVHMAHADAEEEVRRAEAEWARALLASDMRALEAIYSDDLQYIHSSGSIDTKQEFLESIRSGALRFRSIASRESRVRTYGNVGVVNALYDLVLELRGGNVTPMAIQYLTVYVKDGSRWRIVTQQTTRLPASSTKK
jgi:ketosteroid isomerase-like protein